MYNWSDTNKQKKTIDYPTIIKQVWPIQTDCSEKSAASLPSPKLLEHRAECEVSARQSSQMEGVEKVTPQRKARERLPEGETDAGRKNSNSVHIGPSVLTTPSKSRVTKQLSKPFPNSVDSPLIQPAFPGHLLKHETRTQL